MTTLFAAKHLRGQGSMSGPAIGYSLVKRLSRDANFNRPINDTKAFAIVFKDNVSAVVASLLLRCGPLAIVWRIITIVILAVYLQTFFISGGHVGYEVFDILPAFAYRNSATAIAIISLVFWVCATVNNALPNLKKWIAPFTMFGYALFVKASATLRTACAKCVYLNVAGRALARTLNFCKFNVGAFFLEDSKHRVSPVNVAGFDDARNSFNHV